ncbi:hypothetical protein [Salinispora fenicalii]|uniref:hypothetical protein n=1 Tax=Salinispora fenicalii TaxID=1137263 RepID=UPI0004861C33|nr:hypothetical protein [Salinispora fenicalii]
MSQHTGQAAPALIAAQAAALPERRGAAVTNSATLAATIDAWQSGYGVDPTATSAPCGGRIDRFIRTGWNQVVLVGANLARIGPF